MTTHNPPTFETVRAALDVIPPDDLAHDDRARIAFALFDALGDAGTDLWLAWAGRRSNAKPASDRATWKSARKPGPVKAGTLFGFAKRYGFTFEAVQTPARQPTAAEVKAQGEARRAAQEREAQATAEGHRAAALEAARVWDAGAPKGARAYLLRKGVQGHGVRFTPGGDVLVPRRDAAGELWNVETIKAERPADGVPGKLLLKGGRKTGTLHMIGNPEGAAWLLLAEGYATAATCFEATGRPVAMAGDAGNLVHVVRALRGRYPAARLLLCGDDDAGTAARTGKNPGRDKAHEAARLARGLAVFPAGLPAGGSGGTDFNDMQQRAGLEAVRVLIEGAISQAEGAAADQADRNADKGADKRRRTADATDPEKAPPAGRQRAARGKGTDGPGGEVPADRFRVDEDGLWFDERGDDAGSPGRPVKVCGPLHAVALARDAHDTGAALLLEFDTRFRAGRRWLMPLAMLAGDGTAYRGELLNQGFIVPTDTKRRALLTAYLQSRQPADLVRIVDRVGWHGGPGPARVYVLPRETLGDDGGERFMFQSETPTESTFGQRGSLDQWQARIGRLCVGNSRLVLAVCAAFAGPLLAWAGDTDGRGVHIVGDSRSGKTTAMRCGASVMGGPEYMQRWRATDNGIEGMAVQYSDALLCLDEVAQMDGKMIGDAAYMLANGQGKSRAGRTGAARPRLTWRLLFLSTGEIGLAEHMSEAGKKARAGQELRMIDLPADAGACRGVFEELHEFESGGELAEHLKLAAVKTYGTAGRAWLEYLTDNTVGLSRILRDRMTAIEPDLVPEAASGQVRDAGRFFALLAAAGELATEQGLTGWPVGTARAGVLACFNAWLTARPAGIGQSEDIQILRQVREWFGTYGEMNFKRWGVTDAEHPKDVPMMAGWRKPIYADEHNTTGDLVQVEVGRVWYVMKDKFRSTVCKGYPWQRCIAVLKARDLLVCEPSGRELHKAKPPGESKDGADVYRIKSAILSASDD